MLMLPSTHALLTSGAAYSNFSFRGISGPGNSLAGPCLAPSPNRYCIVVGLSISGGYSNLVINGVPATTLVVYSNSDAIFIANVGTHDNAAHDGGYDFAASGNGVASVYDVYMSSPTPHSVDAPYYDSSLGAQSTLQFVETIPANGFAVLTVASGLAAVDQGFTVTTNGYSAYVEKTAAFSGTITATLGSPAVGIGGVFASFAGDGS